MTNIKSISLLYFCLYFLTPIWTSAQDHTWIHDLRYRRVSKIQKTTDGKIIAPSSDIQPDTSWCFISIDTINFPGGTVIDTHTRYKITPQLLILNKDSTILLDTTYNLHPSVYSIFSIRIFGGDDRVFETSTGDYILWGSGWLYDFDDSVKWVTYNYEEPPGVGIRRLLHVSPQGNLQVVHEDSTFRGPGPLASSYVFRNEIGEIYGWNKQDYILRQIDENANVVREFDLESLLDSNERFPEIRPLGRDSFLYRKHSLPNGNDYITTVNILNNNFEFESNLFTHQGGIGLMVGPNKEFYTIIPGYTVAKRSHDFKVSWEINPDIIFGDLEPVKAYWARPTEDGGLLIFGILNYDFPDWLHVVVLVKFNALGQKENMSIKWDWPVTYINRMVELDDSYVMHCADATDYNDFGGRSWIVSIDKGTLDFSSVQDQKEWREDDILHLYPNPASDEVTVDFPNISKWNVHVYHLSGRRVMSQSFDGRDQAVFQRNRLPAGTYIILAFDEINHRRYMGRFVKL